MDFVNKPSTMHPIHSTLLSVLPGLMIVWWNWFPFETSISFAPSNRAGFGIGLCEAYFSTHPFVRLHLLNLICYFDCVLRINYCSICK